VPGAGSQRQDFRSNTPFWHAWWDLRKNQHVRANSNCYRSRKECQGSKNPKGKGPKGVASGSQNNEEVILVSWDEFDTKQKAGIEATLKQFQDKLIGDYTKNRSGKPYLKGTLPEGTLDDVDLSTLSERRTAALREVVNEMVGHAVSRQGIHLINSMKGVVRGVIKEINSGESCTEGPVFGTYEEE
jgi:hypothetical protein